MPYKVEPRGGQFVVVKPDGKVMGTHADRRKALRQLRALYANEPGIQKFISKTRITGSVDGWVTREATGETIAKEMVRCGVCGEMYDDDYLHEHSKAEIRRAMSKQEVPGFQGSIGPSPAQYTRPHVFARDVHSGAGNCVCGMDIGHVVHTEVAPGVDIPSRMRRVLKKNGEATHAGLAVQALDTGRVLMLQRSFKDGNDPARGTWEFPGGKLEDDDLTSLHGGVREWEEEVGQRLPAGGTVADIWTSPDGSYVGHLVTIPREDAVELSNGHVVPNPDDPDGDDAEQAAWWEVRHAKVNPALRKEVKKTPWEKFKNSRMRRVSKNVAGKDSPQDPDKKLEYRHGWIPVHAKTLTGDVQFYHVTRRPEFSTFQPSRAGESGPGVYLAGNREYAEFMQSWDSERMRLLSVTVHAGSGLHLLDRTTPEGEKEYRRLQNESLGTKESLDKILQKHGYSGVYYLSPGNEYPETIIHDPSKLSIVSKAEKSDHQCRCEKDEDGNVTRECARCRRKRRHLFRQHGRTGLNEYTEQPLVTAGLLTKRDIRKIKAGQDSPRDPDLKLEYRHGWIPVADWKKMGAGKYKSTVGGINYTISRSGGKYTLKEGRRKIGSFAALSTAKSKIPASVKAVPKEVSPRAATFLRDDEAYRVIPSNHYQDFPRETVSAIDGYAIMGYREINGYLRGIPPYDKSDPEVLEKIERIDKAFEIVEPIPEDIILYRAVKTSWFLRAEKSREFVDGAFVSTTTDKELLSEFGDVVIDIQIPRGTKAVVVDDTNVKGRYDLDEHETEREVLLPRNSRFEIVKGSGKKFILRYLGTGIGVVAKAAPRRAHSDKFAWGAQEIVWSSVRKVRKIKAGQDSPQDPDLIREYKHGWIPVGPAVVTDHLKIMNTMRKLSPGDQTPIGPTNVSYVGDNTWEVETREGTPDVVMFSGSGSILRTVNEVVRRNQEFKDTGKISLSSMAPLDLPEYTRPEEAKKVSNLVRLFDPKENKLAEALQRASKDRRPYWLAGGLDNQRIEKEPPEVGISTMVSPSGELRAFSDGKFQADVPAGLLMSALIPHTETDGILSEVRRHYLTTGEIPDVIKGRHLFQGEKNKIKEHLEKYRTPPGISDYSSEGRAIAAALDIGAAIGQDQYITQAGKRHFVSGFRPAPDQSYILAERSGNVWLFEDGEFAQASPSGIFEHLQEYADIPRHRDPADFDIPRDEMEMEKIDRYTKPHWGHVADAHGVAGTSLVTFDEQRGRQESKQHVSEVIAARMNSSTMDMLRASGLKYLADDIELYKERGFEPYVATRSAQYPSHDPMILEKHRLMDYEHVDNYPVDSEMGQKILREYSASNLINTWAGTSNDQNENSLAIQETAIDEFDINPDAYYDWDMSDSLRANVDRAKENYGGVFREFLQAQYQGTQEYLREAGITEIQLYRGFTWEYNTPSWALKNGEMDLPPLRPLSSWTSATHTAEEFSHGEGNILVARIPAKMILSTPQTGFGCWGEDEFVCLVGPGKAVNTDAHDLANFLRSGQINESWSWQSEALEEKKKKPSFGPLGTNVGDKVIVSDVGVGEVVAKQPSPYTGEIIYDVDLDDGHQLWSVPADKITTPAAAKKTMDDYLNDIAETLGG